MSRSIVQCNVVLVEHDQRGGLVLEPCNHGRLQRPLIAERQLQKVLLGNFGDRNAERYVPAASVIDALGHPALRTTPACPAFAARP